MLFPGARYGDRGGSDNRDSLETFTNKEKKPMNDSSPNSAKFPKPKTSSFGAKGKPVTHYVVLRGRKTCSLALHKFHGEGVLVAAQPGESVATFPVRADLRSRYHQLETPKAAARAAIKRTREVIALLKKSIISDSATRLLGERGRFSIRGVR